MEDNVNWKLNNEYIHTHIYTHTRVYLNNKGKWVLTHFRIQCGSKQTQLLCTLNLCVGCSWCVLFLFLLFIIHRREHRMKANSSQSWRICRRNKQIQFEMNTFSKTTLTKSELFSTHCRKKCKIVCHELFNSFSVLFRFRLRLPFTVFFCFLFSTYFCLLCSIV